KSPQDTAPLPMIAVCGSTGPDTEPEPPQTAIMETVGGYLPSTRPLRSRNRSTNRRRTRFTQVSALWMRRVTIPEAARGRVDVLGLAGATPCRALLDAMPMAKVWHVGALVSAGGRRRSRNCRCRMLECWPWEGQGGTMSVMATPLAGLPFGRPLTVDDLERMPDDGHRYQL